jgi:outer membrane protein TolC
VAAYHGLDVARGSEERGKLLVENTQVLIQADRLARSEIYDVTANLADRTTSRIAAEQQVIQARQALAIAMGLSSDQLLSLGPPADDWPVLPRETIPATTPDALRYYTDQSLKRRASYLATQKRVEGAAILRKAAVNQLKPQLNLNFSAGYAGIANSRRPWELIYPLGSGIFGPSASGGVTYSFPLGNRFAQGQLMEADATAQQAVLQQSDTARTISSSVIVAATSYENSIPRLGAAHSTVAGFQQALNGEFDKLKLGVGSLVDILTIEDRLTTALNSEVSAELVYATALIQFRFETGTIMTPDKMIQTVGRDVLLTPPFLDVPAVQRPTP